MTLRTFIVTGDDQGPHHSDGTEAYLSLPDSSAPEVTQYPGDIWLKNPQIVAFNPTDYPTDDSTGAILQVTDLNWAVRGLWSALSTLIRIEDVRDLLAAKAPDTLQDLQLITALTRDLAIWEPPVIQEESA